MKILHTSDWHLGRSLHGYSLIEDQAYVLEGLLEKLKEDQVDVLVIAGDIYDKTIPTEAAVELFNHFISKVILEYKITLLLSLVIMIVVNVLILVANYLKAKNST